MVAICLAVGCSPLAIAPGGDTGADATTPTSSPDWQDTAAAADTAAHETGADSGTDTVDTGTDTDTDTDTPPDPVTAALQFDGPRPTNVLMISIDTFRKDFVGPRSSGNSFTPFLDTLRADGVELTAHQSCSNWTYPSVVCALSGQRSNYQSYLPGNEAVESPTMLAELLRAKGYRSTVVAANSLLCAGHPTGDSYDNVECLGNANAEQLLSWSEGQVDDLVSAGGPWFAHLHLMDPHVPYESPAGYTDALDALPPIYVDLTTVQGLKDVPGLWPTLDASQQDNLRAHFDVIYGGQIAYMDDQLRAFWADLEARGVLDDTLVVFWADHGEQMMEHGQVDHGNSLYAEENETLGFFWSPNLIAGEWSGSSSHIDLVPTILDALELAQPKGLEGQILGSGAKGTPVALSLRDADSIQLSITDGNKRMHYALSGEKELYDLSTDPTEQVNIYDPSNPTVTELWDVLRSTVDEVADSYDVTAVDPAP
jgi:arylsulfatase A-like enzyme